MKSKALAVGKSVLWCVYILLFPIISGILSAVFSLKSTETLFLQGTFMLASLILPLVLVLTRRWSLADIGLSKFNRKKIRAAWYFLPLGVIFFPPLYHGFRFESAVYVVGNFFLYAAVGLAEEVYFRGIIPSLLGKFYSCRSVIILSSAIFALGHISSAFVAGSVIEVALVVVNALIFGWLAMEITLVAGSIIPAAVVHFTFDFLPRIIAYPSYGNVRLHDDFLTSFLMIFCAIWLMILLKVHKGDDTAK